MNDKGEIIFEEKQRIGFNRYSLAFRMALAAFCFIAFYYTEKREQNGDLLFFLGIIILLTSIVMFFVVHLHTTIRNNSLEINGLWSMKKVKIDLKNIVLAEKTNYSNYRLNSPTYNLHFKGVIRFYTSGKEAIQLTDKDGLKYIIGTQRSTEFLKAVNESKV